MPETDTVLKKLQKMSEKDLTLKVIIPVLYAIGYEKIEYSGGPYEEGKDIILWRKDEIGLVLLAVAQVKRFRPTARAADNKSFMEVVNQLESAVESSVESTDGIAYKPAIVYFITPYEVDTRALKTRFDKYISLKQQGVKIIDGIGLLSLIRQHVPDLENEIIGFRASIHKATSQKLNNAVLLRALDFKGPKAIDKLYSDLDITFGSVSGGVFSAITIDAAKSVTLILNEDDWHEFRVVVKAALKLSIQLVDREPADVDKEFLVKAEENLRASEGGKVAKPKPIQIKLLLSAKAIAEFILEKQQWLLERISILNDQQTSTEAVRQILFACQHLFDFTDLLIRSKFLLSLFLYKHPGEGTLRIKLPIEKLIGTGLSIAVLGEAGAGKTTCLQMQAKRLIATSGHEKYVIFMPLANVVRSLKGDGLLEDGNFALNKLLLAMTAYFRAENAPIPIGELTDAIEKGNSLILFDGIDEVIVSAPWIIQAIKSFSERFKRSQIICSARSGGKYIQDIPFIGIKLLPFTDQQRKSFISGWFGSPTDTKVFAINKHLIENPPLSAIVRSPLLATILCVLAEHNVKLPDKEIRLYQERMKLLLGGYDLYKQTVRIVTPEYVLNLLARKMAYYMNTKSIREMEFDELATISSELCPEIEDTKSLHKALEELIHPCNILVPESSPTSFGFGHFRYQEYLAATELNQNRGIEVQQYLSSEFWRGTLTLFSQLTDDVYFLYQYAFNRRILAECKSSLEAIFSVRPMKERDKLFKQLQQSIQDETKYRDDPTHSQR
jgi:hypothetical protein